MQLFHEPLPGTPASPWDSESLQGQASAHAACWQTRLQVSARADVISSSKGSTAAPANINCMRLGPDTENGWATAVPRMEVTHVGAVQDWRATHCQHGPL